MNIIRVALLIGLVGIAGNASLAFGEEGAKTSPLEDVVKLVDAGLSEEVLLAWAETHKEMPELNTDEILSLKKKKVPEKVIAAMIRRSAQLQKPREIDKGTGDVRIVERYQVPRISKDNNKALGDADYRQAETRRAYSQKEAVTYVYRQPARTVYYDTTPRVTYLSSTPYSYGYYPRYYSSSFYYPRTYFYPYLSFRFNYGHRGHHYRHHYNHHRYYHYGHRGHGHRGHGHRGHGHRGHRGHRTGTRF